GLTAPFPGDLEIEIRTIAQFKEGIPFRSAKLIWPPPERWQQLAELDIALLEIESDPTTKAAAQRIPLGTDGLPRDREMEINFTGFPRLMTIKNGDNRDAKQMFGVAAPA